jgi:phosphoenolpyruvate carboxykinase (GTP)
VLKWVVERVYDRGDAVDTPIGRVPAPGAIDTTGLDISDAVMEELLNVDAASWRAELPQVEEHFTGIGDTLPATLADELTELDKRLAQ